MSLILEMAPWLFMVGGGIYALIGGLFPPDPKEHPEFYRWEVDAHTPLSSRVLAQGMMTPAKARAVALVVGGVLIVGGVLGLLHHFQLPPFSPSDVDF